MLLPCFNLYALISLFYFCVYVFDRFMDAGGWNVLNVWLSEAKRSQNNPLMLEILLVSVCTHVCVCVCVLACVHVYDYYT